MLNQSYKENFLRAAGELGAGENSLIDFVAVFFETFLQKSLMRQFLRRRTAPETATAGRNQQSAKA